MSVKQLPTRSEVDPRYTWNAESVFPTVDDWSTELAAMSADLPGLRQWQGHLADGPSVVADALEALDAYRQRIYKVYMYAAMGESVDTTDQAATARVSQAGSLLGQVMGATAYLEPELLAIGLDQLRAWQADETRLAVYDHYFDDLFRRQAHVRSQEVEEVLGLAQDAFSGPYMTLSKLADSDFRFAPASAADGQAVELTQGTLDDILSSADREARRTAWQNYHDQYLAYKNTLASNLSTSIKQNVLQSQVRRYPSTLEMALFENNVPVDVFHNLLETFQRHCHVWERYWNVRRRALGVDTLHTYDVWAPLTADSPEVPYEQAVEWIAEALAPLGDDYSETLRRGCLEQRWVDVYPNKGKTSGAFSAGTPGHLPVHPHELRQRRRQHGHAGPRAGPLDALLSHLGDTAGDLQRLLALCRRGGLQLQSGHAARLHAQAGHQPRAEDRRHRRGDGQLPPLLPGNAHAGHV